MEHLGEAIFRDDLDNSILELGDLLTHEGPALQAQKEAAAIFGAEKTYFVLNGTSSSNKIVLTNLVAEGDLVLFDRNNHKAAHHGALLMAGAIPIFLSADRNAYGLIGPIRSEDLNEKSIRARIRDHPLVKDKDAWRHERPFRLAVIKQCTYDGTIYDAERIVERIGHLCDYILIAAAERGRGLEFCSEVAALLWDGSVTGWDQGTHLEEAAARAGLRLAELDAAIIAEPRRYEESLAENDRLLRAAGH
jgi:arginine/lysine/ornithine decarboxylase